MDKEKERGQNIKTQPSVRQDQGMLKQTGRAPDNVTGRAHTPFLLLPAAGGMELCWLSALAAYFTAAASAGPFPLPQAVGVFWLAALLTLLTRGRGWRVIQTVLLHLAGLTAAVLCILYVFYDCGEEVSFFDKRWLAELFSGSKEPLEAFILSLIIIFSAAFYFSGLALARRPHIYTSVTRRLDLGIGIFLLLLFVNAGLGLPGSAVVLYLFPFFFFSMTAAALARNRGEGQKEYLPGQRWMGLVLTFAATVLLFSVGAVLLFLPYLTAAAEGGLLLLKWVFTPFFTSFLLPLLKFIFGARSGGSIAETGELSGDGGVVIPDSPSGGFWGELLTKIFSLGVLGLAGLAVLIAICWGAYRLFRLLLSRSPESGEHRDFWGQVSLWLAVLLLWWKKLLSFARRITVRSVPEYSGAAGAYRSLLSWGRSCGLPRLPSETPREYGLRLGSYFPAVKIEIELITGYFSREIYGEIPVHERQLVLLRRARRKLSNPLLWFSRFIHRKP